MIAMKNQKKKKKKNRGLFVFPLQSRMTGTSYSYQWMTLAQEHGWHVLLDACALGPKDMDSFGLSLINPDLLICSFYKVFGQKPSGIGCLIIKKSVVPILEDSAIAGAGIVTITPSSVAGPGDTNSEANETSGFHENASIPTERSPDQEKKTLKESGSSHIECRSLDHVDSCGLMLINSRGRYLINWLVTALLKLQHPHRLENFPMVKIYGPKVKFDRGPALAFNIYDWKGEKVEPSLVQKLADQENISLGWGVLQHIWSPDKGEEERQRILDRNIEGKETARPGSRKCDQGIAVVTVALTFLVNFEDVYRLWAFVARFLDADFVEKGRWRNTALNQNAQEVQAQS